MNNEKTKTLIDYAEKIWEKTEKQGKRSILKFEPLFFYGETHGIKKSKDLIASYCDTAANIAAADSVTVINSIPSGGLELIVPGTYEFGNTIEWEGSSLFAIYISGPNITLDFKGYQLIQRAPAAVQACAIALFMCDNTVLKNGDLLDWTGISIIMVFCTNVNLQHIKIEGVTHENASTEGTTIVSLEYCSNVCFTHVVVQDVYVEAESLAVFSLYNCDAVTFEHVSIERIRNSVGLCSGIAVVSCTNLIIKNTVVNELYSGYEKTTYSAGHTCIGIVIGLLGIGFAVGKIAVTTPGAGYTVPPAVHVEPTANGATASAVLNPLGAVTSIPVLSTGTAFDFRPTVTIDAPPPGGVQAVACVDAPSVLREFAVLTAAVTNGGSGYTSAPAVIFISEDGRGSGATAVAFLTNGAVTSIVLIIGGTGYKYSPGVQMVGECAEPAAAVAIVGGFCEKICIENCVVQNIYGSCDDAHGISLCVVSQARIHNVHVQNVQDGNGATPAAKATGIEIYGDPRVTDSQITLTHCTAENIVARLPGDLQAAGFSMAGAGITLTACNAKNVRVPGFVPSADLPGAGKGFAWAPDIRMAYAYPAQGILLENCSAAQCDVGFDTFNYQYSTWTWCSARGCTTAVVQPLPECIRTFTCTACSECDVEDGETAYVPVVNVSAVNRVSVREETAPSTWNRGPIVFFFKRKMKKKHHQ